MTDNQKTYYLLTEAEGDGRNIAVVEGKKSIITTIEDMRTALEQHFDYECSAPRLSQDDLDSCKRGNQLEKTIFLQDAQSARITIEQTWLY
jgi:hypothetical protein